MASMRGPNSKRPWTLLVSCEHGGYKVPPVFLKQIPAGQRKDLPTHKGWDQGALVVAKYLAEHLQAPLFFTQISRLLVDCNRSAHHAQCLGPSFRVLPPTERNFILAAYYWPHRNAIEGEIINSLRQGYSVLHVAIHSFTPRLNGEVRNAELGLLYDPSRASEKFWANHLAAEWQAARPDLRLRRNYPYLGTADGLTTWLRKHYGQNQYAGLEIEINQALFKEPSGVRIIKKNLLRTISNILDSSR